MHNPRRHDHYEPQLPVVRERQYQTPAQP